MNVKDYYNEIWLALAQKKNVIVFFELAVDSPDLIKRSKPLIEWLKPNIKTANIVDFQMKNGAFLLIRKPIKRKLPFPINYGGCETFKVYE